MNLLLIKKTKNTMKRFLLLAAFLANCFIGCALSAVVGVPPAAGCIAVNAIAAAPLFNVPCLRAGIYVEIWTGEQIKAFREDVKNLGWLAAIPSYDQYVRPGIGNEADIIHLVTVGADPEVLINNTTYPIAIVALPDGDKAISLDKYQTTATPVTDDELHAISYDKMSSVVERHTQAVNETKYVKALHALAPQTHSEKTPVLKTTGATAPEGGRKMLIRADIITLKKAFDKIKCPVKGRILVLCPDHIADLLAGEQKFAEQYYNYTTGKIANLYGFEVYEFTACPYFTQPVAGQTPAPATKVPYGAIPGETDTQASVAFFAPRMFKATGTTTTYPTQAEATMQQHLYNVRHYFVTLPKKQEAIGAIYSAAA
ncbi:MAG: hypothetical protein LBK13_13725 [Spirochaetales bacterium]|nr:hypothetical protein [Spirochaetales bacterium]